MTGYLSDGAGRTWRLPTLLSWDITHGLGEPCDAFEVAFLYGAGLAETLRAACRFRAEYDGRTVFAGVVDEYEIKADGGGLTASVNGRGLAALLMDNEAEAAEYDGAGLEFILDRHVRPLGITDIRKKSMRAAARFSVSPGESHWRVLDEYCRFCGGVAPRFSREGTLLLDGSDGESFVVGASAAVAAQRYTGRRYGVISEVLVRNRGVAAAVENADFKARGGACRRVVNVPRSTGYDAMRYTGAYQIARSEEDAEICEITLPEPFAAFAGDLVALRASPAGITGDFRVYESRTRADGEGAETILKLTGRK